ncbi:translocation/assembly module TamB domain-containing protein [Mesorhizobium sp. M00.F.Ca.ET.216.01.1.1]|uniref:translocation/assembly module TamB domain-containing protein n=1 Tax=Mesorhizobium sp. M00.F.Ca.ET.216.01.1.1 TaxID=2500528 RepID=UPI001FE209E7|nr:translocation/assembly module TamB domain-containing protein [Mesorhizobium sp. M00.F.Ca.ET.216.01.1.1]
MKMLKRILRIVLYTLLIVMAATAGALVVLTKTERGRDNLAGIVSTMASTPDRKVTVSGIDGIWSGALRLDQVVLEDREGAWLVARNVAVDWSPLALLWKSFSADRIATDRIELARLPVARTQPSQGGTTTLPVSIDIKQIDLSEIALGPDLAGSGVAELTAKGALSASASPLAVETNLNIARRDGKQGTVDAKVHFAPANNKLDLDLKASEPAGGIIANLLNLPDAPPVDIVVSGTGPVANWSGIGTFVVDGRIVTQLTGRHQLTDRGNHVEAKGDGDFARFLPEKLRPLFAGRTSFDLAGTAIVAGGIDVERASIDSDAVHGTAAGIVDPNGASDLSVELTAKGPPIVLSVGSAAQPVTVAIKGATARAFGGGKTPIVDIGASLVSVVAGGTRLDDLAAAIHSDGFDIQNRSGPVTIKLVASGLNTDVATLAPLVTGQVAADLAGSISKDEVVVDRGTLSSDALNASLTAKVTLADLSMQLKMNADAVSTALPPQISAVLGARVKFSATATRDPQGSFAANSLELSSGSLSASGTASAQGTDIQADIKGTLGDVSVLSPMVGVPVAGGIDFALTASGARSAPDFSVSANSDSLTASNRTVKTIKLSATGKADITNPAADVSLTGSVDDQPLDLKASLVTSDGKRSVNGLSLSLGDNKVSGDLALDDSLLPLGTLTLYAPDIGPLASLAGQTAAGDVQGTIRFSNDGAPTVAIDATSTSISRGDLAAKTIAVNALVANYLKDLAISGTIKADTVTSGTTVINGIGVDLKRDGEWTGFAGGATIAGIPATAAGRVKIANGTTSIEIASGEATVHGIKAIAEPSGLTIANGMTNIERLVLDLGGGSVTVSGTAGQTLDLAATFSALPAALANDFSTGLDAAGTLDGTAQVSGSPASPDIRFNARLAGAETSQTRQAGLGPLSLNAAGRFTTAGGIAIDQATLAGEKISGKAAGIINPNGASDFSLDLTSTGPSLPLALGSTESPINLELQALSLKVTGQGMQSRLNMSATLPSVATNLAKAEGIALALHSDAFDLKGRTGPISGTVSADKISSDNPTIAPLLAGKITAKVAGDLATDTIVIDSGSVTSEALDSGFNGLISLAGGAIDLNLKADAASAALPEAVRGVLAERTQLSAALKRDANGNITANAVRLVSGALSADGQASLADNKLNADVKGALTDISLLSKDAKGAFAFALNAQGASTAPDLSLTVNSDRLSVAAREITGLKLTATGKADIASPAAEVSLTGSVNDEPLDFKASLVTRQGKRSINGLSLSLGDNKVSGDLALDDRFLPLGTVALDLPDISPLAALALENAKGDVRGTIAFSQTDNGPNVAVKATTDSISRGDISAEKITIDALIANYLAAPVISGKIRADSVTSGGTVIRGIDVDLSRDGDWTRFSGGATVEDIPATAAGRVKIADGTTAIVLASGEATVRGIKAVIAQPSMLTVANGVTSIEKLTLDVGGGSVSVSGTADQTLDLAATFSALPAALVNDFSPGLDAAGTLGGTAQVTGSASAPDIRFNAQLAGAETNQTRQAGLGPLAVDAAGRVSTAGGIVIDHATLSGEKISGKAAGTVNPNGASDFSLDLASTGPSLPLALGSTESPINLELQAMSVKVAGQGMQSRLNISAVLPSVATNFAKVESIRLALHSDAFDVKGRTGPISGTVTVDKIGLDNPTITPLLAGQITAKVAGSLATDVIVIDSGSVQGEALDSGFNGRVSLTGGAIDLNLKADAASAALPAAVRGVLAERTQLSAALKRDANGNVSASAVRLVSGALSADGQASLADNKVNADVKGALTDISLLSKDAQGAIAFTLNAQGASTAPDLSLTVNSDRLSVAAREITGLKLTATGKADAANPAANVQLTGNVAGQALQGSAVLATSDGKRAINGLLLSLGKNRISGNLALDDAFVPAGTVALDVPDIGPLAALALEKAEGDVRGTIAFSKTGNGPNVAVKATTASISRGDISAKKVAIDALIANYLAAPVISGKVRADSVTSGDTVIRGIDVDLKRDGDWTGFSGGATVKDIPAKAAGRVKVANGTTTVELASGQATMRGVKAAIAQTSTITIANGSTSLDRLVLNLGGGTATVTGKAGQALDLNAALARVPISLANSFSPGLDAAGSISGTVKVTGAPLNPAVAFNIDAAGVQTSQTRGAGFGGMSVSSSGTFASNKLAFQANIGDGSGLGLKGGGTVTTAGTPTLALDFSGKVPFAFLTQKLAAQGLSLSGTADVNIQVRGPATAPVISGTVRTAGSRLLDARSGLAVNDIAADVLIGGGVARINRLTGTLSTRGSLSASGTVGINPAQGFPADLSVRLVDGRYTDGKVVTANLSGDLTIKGPLASAPVISGTINLAKTVITVPNKLPGSLEALDVKHKNAPSAVRAQDRALRPATASNSGGGSGLTLDVTVNAPNQIFIQGRGVDAELGGSLKLTGPASAPQAVGNFTLQRGRLTILAKRLTFTEGTVGFSGSLVPYLNLTATSTTSSATVTIVVSGEATNPKFNFSSVPALPEDEVLAQLIFGRSMSNLSPLQIAQLAEAAGQLAGIGGSTSLLENLRGAIGVDDLDVITDEQGGTAVSAGKYLNDRTYVTIQKGDKPGSGKAAIDFNVGRGVKLRGEATDAGEAKGGVFYEREY